MSHSETNTGLTEGKSIVDSFACESAAAARFLHGCDEHVLIRWRSSVKNLCLLLDIHLEVFLGIFTLELICVTTFNWVFFLIHEFRELGSELRSRNNSAFVSFLDDANVKCSFEG